MDVKTTQPESFEVITVESPLSTKPDQTPAKVKPFYHCKPVGPYCLWCWLGFLCPLLSAPYLSFKMGDKTSVKGKLILWLDSNFFRAANSQFQKFFLCWLRFWSPRFIYSSPNLFLLKVTPWQYSLMLFWTQLSVYLVFSSSLCWFINEIM